MTTRSSKLRALEEAQAIVSARRCSGARIVLANGVFDLLHVGHVRYLQAARALGDMLVVAVNSDASTRRYKGPTRPIVPEEERAELLAALESVDLVVVFDEPDVRRVLDTLRPDVHAKGTDYTRETIPERSVVEGYGGRVEVCGDPKAHASTDVIAKIRSLEPENT